MIEFPKSLNECTAYDEVSPEIELWSKRVKKTGLFIAIIVMIATVITAIVLISAGESAVVIYVLGGGFAVAFVEYGICWAISLLLAALASITYNTHVSAMVQLYSNRPDVETVAKKFDSKMECDNSKDSDVTNLNDNTHTPVKAEVYDDGKWVCPSCKKTNLPSNKVCWNCSTKLFIGDD